MAAPAGLRDERITIETATTTLDAEREPVSAWTTLRSVWAQVISQRGSEFVAGAADTGTALVAFLTPYQGDVDNTMRVVWRARNYEILAVDSGHGKNETVIKTRWIGV